VKMVLVADDNANIRRLVQLAIVPSQCTLMEASNGDDAWALIQRHRPAVVLLDVNMPGRGGLDLTRDIKSDSALAMTRVILLTANTQQADIERGMTLGADQYVTKPFSPLKLRQIVERALE
jgi:two-component system phosphate regulon response regulator PhoB